MIHGFGDSYTEGQPINCTFPPFVQWKELRGGNLPKCWLELLGDKMNMEITNYARGGNSNQHIFDDICKNSHKFNSGDIVIVNWTYKTRFRWASFEKEDDGQPVYSDKYGNPMDNWRRMATNEFDGDYLYITKETKNEILTNRLSSLYSDEIYTYEKLLEEYSKSKGFKIFFWSTDNDIINNLPDEERKVNKYILSDVVQPGTYPGRHMGGDLLEHIMMCGGQTIFEETNKVVLDSIHFGESGHKVQSELFYDYIIKHI